MIIEANEIQDQIYQALRSAGQPGMSLRQLALHINTWIKNKYGSDNFVSDSSIRNYTEKMIEDTRIFKRRVPDTNKNEYVAMDFHEMLPRVKETAASLSEIDSELPPEEQLISERKPIQAKDLILLYAEAITVLRKSDGGRYAAIEDLLFNEIKKLLL